MMEKIWSGKSLLFWVLLPLSLLYGMITLIRLFCYRTGLLSSWRAPVPVVIIGNLTAGGNGKTPLVIWLVEQLTGKGLKVGVISRGYGGKSDTYPLLLDDRTTTDQAGDEPVLIYQRTAVPVAVGPNRRLSIEALLTVHKLDLIITDDGLQHYALQRDLEFVVVDGVRRFGNSWWLPAGPMRERATRLKSVDAVIVNGGEAQLGEAVMQLVAAQAINLMTGEQVDVTTLTHPIAMAGIGYPPRFFKTLALLGVQPEATHAFSDHQHFTQAQLSALTTVDQSLIMTEKDAVKCRQFAQPNWWYLPVNAVISSSDSNMLLTKIDRVLMNKKATAKSDVV